MPELPEVETIKEGLNSRIRGRVIKDIEIREPKLFRGDEKKVVGAEIKKVWRRAKVLLVELSQEKIASSRARNDIFLAIHLKMTGQLVYQGADCKIKVVGGHPQAEYNQPLPHGHTHIIFDFTDGSRLYFNDLRKFGWVAVFDKEELKEQTFIKDVGPEPLAEEFKSQISNLKMTIQNSKRAIKTLLMDQSFIAGIGNIYSDEILYDAGVRPDRLAGSISDEEIAKIFKVIPEVLKHALEHGGTSDSTFIGVDGERGDYLKHAYVYHKFKDPKGHKIITKKIGGRTAHFCEICQR
ncbi:MAG: bifunctional DNA-formamidopyrimidine glycosylase/DNA-(apurinic or apyrimidinic site) lyase [bacterium]|nr:bifunctional DNA-formamidopyrimidine glycosylase/DNA-(apurinic or apyrimidinic site) lyase [bacterium]